MEDVKDVKGIGGVDVESRVEMHIMVEVCL